MTTQPKPNFDAFWILGTDTNVGKTVVSSLFAAGLGATYWKPIQSGLEHPTDTEQVAVFAELPSNRILPERFRLNTPASPHKSARIDNISIELEDFNWPEAASVKGVALIMEGAGGFLVPVNEKALMSDVVQRLSAPVILVCRSSLGTINHSLLTINALRELEIPIAGFVINGEPDADNRAAIEHYGKIKCLAVLPALEKISREILLEIWHQQDIRAKLSEYLSGRA